MRRTSLVFAAILLTVIALAAQQTPGQSQPPLTFKVEVNYVEIDATAVDAEGSPVRDLAKDDFHVSEEGRPQALTVFSRVDLPVERPDPPLFKAAAAIEPDVRSNRREFDGRIFVLILDNLHTGMTRTGRLRAAATQFVERYLGANDVAAVVQTGVTKSGAQEFTSSRSLLLRAVNQFAGQKLSSGAIEKMNDAAFRKANGLPGPGQDPFEAERASKARQLLTTLRSAAEYLSGMRGRRKAVVLFSEGIDYDINNPIQNRYGSDIIQDLRTVMLVLEVGASKFRFTEKDGRLHDEVEIAAIPIDSGGSARGGVIDTVTITPRPATRDAILASGVRIVRRLDIQAGRYQLRVGARESGSGSSGTVLLDLDVPDFGKAPLTMSGLALTWSDADATPTARSDEQLRGVLPAEPTVVRNFATQDTIAVFCEIYDQVRPPHRVEIKTTATSDDGTVVFSHTDERRGEELRARGDGFGHVRGMPLKAFSPGRYVLRVEARALVSDGGGTAVRELEFRVR